MQDFNIKELESFACKLADTSGAVIRKYYRNFGAIESKGDESPVTIADKETEKSIRKLIAETYPLHGIQGEEFGLENAGAALRWVIDPIDGTTSFMIGRPTFGTLIALTCEGRPILGIIDQPINGERWVGAVGAGSVFYKFADRDIQQKSLAVRECSNLSSAIIATTGPNYFNAEKLVKFNNIASHARYTVYGGDCYSYGLLAMGMLDAVVESGLKAHDFLALKVIVEEAGGISSDWLGKPLDINSNGDVVFCGDKKIHEEILAMLNG